MRSSDEHFAVSILGKFDQDNTGSLDIGEAFQIGDDGLGRQVDGEIISATVRRALENGEVSCDWGVYNDDLVERAVDCERPLVRVRVGPYAINYDDRVRKLVVGVYVKLREIEREDGKDLV